MRISAKGITGIGAIAVAVAFAGCECTVGHEEPRHPPPPPPPAVIQPAAAQPAAASAANPPAAAPLPPGMRARLEKRDGG
jgi:hypothetical protein